MANGTSETSAGCFENRFSKEYARKSLRMSFSFLVKEQEDGKHQEGRIEADSVLPS